MLVQRDVPVPAGVTVVRVADAWAAAAAVVTAAAAWGVETVLADAFGSGLVGETAALAGAIVAGLAVFVGAAMLLDVDEVRAALGALGRRDG